MRAYIKCKCRAKFELSSSYKRDGEIHCPNCGTPLPNGASEDIINIFSNYEALHVKLMTEMLYSVKFEDE